MPRLSTFAVGFHLLVRRQCYVNARSGLHVVRGPLLRALWGDVSSYAAIASSYAVLSRLCPEMSLQMTMRM